MKLVLSNGATPNSVILTAEGAPTIERGADGAVTAWRVFKPGPVSLTMDGTKVSGDITAADISSIYDYHRMKGESIPVDCEHLIAQIADLAGVEEAELLKTSPLLGERAAVGMVRLTDRAGEIWAEVEKWSARGAQLLTLTADKFYNYFSPVLRGLKNGPLRITSFALTNVPAINDLDALAAAGEGGLPTWAKDFLPKHKTQGSDMKIIGLLCGLLGVDAAKFTGEGVNLESLLQSAHDEIKAKRDGIGAFVAGVKDALQLKDGQGLEAAAPLIVALVEKQKVDTTKLTDLTTQVTELTKAERVRVVDELKAKGKLTDALLATDLFKVMTVAQLRDWGNAAPVLVEPSRITKPEDRALGGEGIVTENQLRIAGACGVSADAFAKHNGLTLPAVA